MKLTPEQMDHLKNHLQNTLRNPCAICGSGNWQFDDTIFEIRQFVGGGLSTEGLIKPIVTLACNSCGNIIFLNAITTGVVRVVAQDQPVAEQQAPAELEN